MSNKLAIFIGAVLWIISSTDSLRLIKFPRDNTFDEECSLADGTHGKCVNIKNCSTLGKTGGPIKTCYFDKFDEIVCCPIDKANNSYEYEDDEDYDEEEELEEVQSKRPFDKVCQEYYPIPKQTKPRADGTLIRGILYGNYTLFDEFPFMVALGWESSQAYIGLYEYKCGGVLIAPDFVLTAAHCAVHGLPAVVLPGGIDLINTSVEPHTISNIKVHPDYKDGEIYNDIAILRLHKPITNHLPACLWDREFVDNYNVTAIGYGHSDFHGQRSPQLLKGFLSTIPSDECHEYFRLSPRAYQGIVHTQLCAKDPEKRQSTCQGDSGGPIIYYDLTGGVRRPYILGITSQGVGCSNNFPGVYTRVAMYLDWIEQVVWHNETQQKL